MASSFLAFAAPIGGADAAVPPVAAPVPDRVVPMQIRVVGDSRPGCAPACGRWIAMDGKIEPGTAAAFERVLRTLGSRRLPIFIDSGGGSVADAMAIGRRIRARHLDVVVTATVLDGCAAASPCTTGTNDRGGRPKAAGARCASACVLILAAGERRGAAPWTGIGVHRMVSHETRVWRRRFFKVWTRLVGGVRVVVDRELVGEKQVAVEHRTVDAAATLYDEVGAYLDRMGERSSLVSLMEATPAASIHWLSREEEMATAIVTDTADGDVLLAEAARAPAAGSGPRRIASERAFLLLPGSSKTVVVPARVTWRIDRPTPPQEGATSAAVLKAAVELAGAKTIFTLDFTSRATGAKSPLIADFAFSLPDRASAAITRAFPLAKRPFAATARTDLTGAAVPVPVHAFRAVVAEGADLAKPLPSGDPAWISARAVTADLRIAEILFEMPPPPMLDEVAKARDGTAADGRSAGR